MRRRFQIDIDAILMGIFYLATSAFVIALIVKWATR